jgi:cytochrome o ubiquinol oxidase subunit 2
MPFASSFLARAARLAPAFLVIALLGGCQSVVLNPAGDVARRQANMVEIATVLMLLIVIPVMSLIVLFAWRYRSTNEEAHYDPDWHHSTQLELVIWTAPLLIIIALGAVTWVGTHLLDPYRMIGHIDATHDVPANARPLEIDVVALDWKWLFIYPEQKIATVNQLVLPTNRPVRFRITSSSVMNSFYAPALAGQIYAMPGMQTTLNAVLNREGDYTGISANYSGAGFSHMHFAMKGVAPAAFDAWVSATHGGQGSLDRSAYLTLAKPSEKEPVRTFANVAPDLFDRVVNMCVEPGKMCASQMMALDARGGTGLSNPASLAALSHDRAPAPFCADNTPGKALQRNVAVPSDLGTLHGSNLSWPAAGVRAALILPSLSVKTGRPLS